MKNFTTNLMIAAAALTIAAGVAGAQTIKAEVPFGFSAAGKAMPAGLYLVNTSQTSSLTVFKLSNVDAHRAVLAVPYAHNIQKAAEAQAALTFECSGTDCTLVKVAPGSGQSYQLWKPKTERDDTHLAVIRAVLVNGR